MSKRSIATVVVLAVLGLLGVAAAAFLVGGDDRRVGAFQATGSAGALALRLDNVWLPGLRSIDGCRPTADIVKTRVVNSTGGATTNKHLSRVKVQPCVLRLHLGDNQVGLLRWIRDMLAGQPQRKDIMLAVPNPGTGKQATSLQVEDALISSVRFPSLNSAASNATAELELTILPDRLTRTDYGNAGPSMPSTQMTFRAASVNNYALNVQGLTDSSFAIGAAPFTVEQKVIEQTVGELRDYQQVPSELEFGNWAVTLPSSKLTQYNNWFQSFVLQGLNGANQEKTGSLEIYGYGGIDLLFTLNFTGLGLFDADDVGGTLPGRSYSLYVEGVTMTVGPPVAVTTTSTTTPTTTTGTTAATTSTTATTTGSSTTGTTTTTAEPPPGTDKAPAAPLELRGTLTEKGVALEWAPVEEAEGYVILMAREPGGDYAEVARSERSTVVVETLESRPPYYFVVRAVRGDTQSANSEEVAVKE